MNDIEKIAEKYSADIKDCDHKHAVEVIREKNIVAVCKVLENGPRALGNKVCCLIPTFEDGKDLLTE